jgi:hypothetical protein
MDDGDGKMQSDERIPTFGESASRELEGGSLAEIFRCRRATKWLLLNA